MTAPLTTDRQKSFHLLALVCEDLSTAAIDSLVREGHDATASQLIAVRLGRKTNLPWLIDLIKHGLPQFRIPAEALPAPHNAPLFQEQE